MKMAIFLSIGLFFILIVLSAAYFISQSGDVKRAEVTIGERAFRVEIADTMAARAGGLSGRQTLGGDEGMLFVFGYPARHSFWMKGMMFPIDIIWIRGGKIIGFSENLLPQNETSFAGLETYSPPEPADTVLEINAGLVSRYEFKAGDEVKIINNQ